MSMDPFEKWLVVLLIRGGAIAITWCAIGWFLRNLSAGRVSAWWRGGVLALLAIAILPPDLALLRIPVATRAPASESASIAIAYDDEVSAGPAALSPIAPRPPLKPLTAWWTWVWLVGAVVLGSRLLLSHLRVAALIRTAMRVQNPEVLALLPEEAGRNRQAPRVELKMHPRITTPFASGLFRRVIVLPESALSQPGHLTMMIRHEWAHFKRGDLVTQLLAEIAAALHWPNPFVWILKRRLRSAQEAAADDQVLSAGFDGPSYASLLFESAANECRSAREPMVVPMARVSTLRHRIGLLLDTTRSREIAHPLLRYGLLGIAGIAAVTLGLGSVRAEPENESSATWSRRYRDTLRLENSFADRFGGTSTEALAEFRKDLEGNQVAIGESVKLELSPDKKTLVVDFADSDRPTVETKLLPAMGKAGWWRDSGDPRKKSVERVLSPLRGKMIQGARELARMRASQNLIDPDPENPSAVISISDPRLAEAEQKLPELRQRIAALEEQAGRLRQLKSSDITGGLRILQMQDDRIRRLHDSLLDAVADRATLWASGVGEKHPQFLATVSQIEILEAEMTKDLTKLKTAHAQKLEAEKETLAKAESEFEEASKKQVEDRAHVGAYVEAKAEYLRSKRLYESAEIKYEIEDLERANLGRVR